MRPRHVLRVLGTILKPFALVFLLPGFVDLYDGETVYSISFFLTSLATFLLGMLLTRRGPPASDMARTEGMAVVAGAWLVAALLGALPYLQQGLGFVDGVFESMSGFTTTGSTIFLAEHWESASRGLLFWRCQTQWFGGMGIIVLFVAVLPALAVAGRQMFFAEAPGPEEEALTPRIRHTAVALWRLYVMLTALETVALRLWGDMGWFDAICHSFTTLAAGGFSPHPSSLAGHSVAAQWVVIPFMFLAGASFALQFRALRKPSVVRRDTEFRAYFWIVLFASLLLALLLASHEKMTFEASLRHGLFQTLSIITTTGYASHDFNTWAQGALVLLAALMFIGGCAGSAGGGPKVVRIVVLAKFFAREVLFALHPRAVRTVRMGGRPIPRETMRQIVGFLVAYLTTFAAIGLAAGILENSLSVGFTGSIATLGNIGPGFGPIGPMGTFGELGVLTKLIFIIAMWVGRLEVMTVFVLLHPDVLRTVFWRR